MGSLVWKERHKENVKLGVKLIWVTLGESTLGRGQLG